MNSREVKKAAWNGVATSYGRVLLRVILGLLTFRLLYQGLDAESFGFWALLWSVFGYGVLLDFGFGSAALKRMAEGLASRDWDSLSRSLSTIFFFYLAIAAGIGVGGWFLADSMLSLLGVFPGQRDLFLPVARVFFVGLALGFPSGLFPEMLRGLQRMDLANRIAMVGLVSNAIFIALALFFDWSLVALVIGAVACVVLPDVAAGWVALRLLPEVRLRPSLFSFKELLSTSRFSLFVWISTMSYVLRNKSDQLVVGLFLSLPAVALYQAAGKVAEMFGLVTKQISEALSPAAAYLHADGRSDELRECFLHGLRITVMVSTPIYLCAAVHVDSLVMVLTGDGSPSDATVWAAQFLLLWFYQMTFTHLVFRRMFTMCGWERRLMRQGLSEGVLNVLLSVALTIQLKSVVGVALGSLLPAVILGWGVLWRWAATEMQLGGVALFKATCLRTILSCLPMLVVGLLLRMYSGDLFGGYQLLQSLFGLVAMGFSGGIGIWLIALTNDERKLVWGFARRLIPQAWTMWRSGAV